MIAFLIATSPLTTWPGWLLAVMGAAAGTIPAIIRRRNR